MSNDYNRYTFASYDKDYGEKYENKLRVLYYDPKVVNIPNSKLGSYSISGISRYKLINWCNVDQTDNTLRLAFPFDAEAAKDIVKAYKDQYGKKLTIMISGVGKNDE